MTPRSTVTAEPDTSVNLTAASGTIRPAPETSTLNWLYEGELPGPELRVQESDVLSVELINDLPEETTIHWHGIPVANPMDGVPNVTQDMADEEYHDGADDGYNGGMYGQGHC